MALPWKVYKAYSAQEVATFLAELQEKKIELSAKVVYTHSGEFLIFYAKEETL